MSALPVVLVTEPLDPEAIAWLARVASIHPCRPGDKSWMALAGQARALIVRTRTVVDERLLDQLPRLAVVARAGVGLENIDIAACRRRGAEVVYTPDANTQAVVEFLLRMLLERVRPSISVTRPLDDEAWEALRERAAGRRELRERALGILGLGRIGRRVAAVASALGMPVMYNDLLEIPPHARSGARPVDLATLASASDVLTIHVDGRPGNRHFVGADMMRRLRDDVVIVNMSRGLVVDDTALAAFLDGHPGATAIVDVHDPEPIPAGAPLLRCPNAILTPHIAARTTTAMANMSWVVRDVAAVLEGRAPACAAPL